MTGQQHTFLSVVIRTFNQAQFIGDAIQSCLVQSYPHFEVVIADDCSQDDTEAVARRYQDSRIRYFRNETNLGRVGNKRRALLDYATGDWCLFLDADDYLCDPDFFQDAIRLISGHNDIVVVTGGHYIRFGDELRHKNMPCQSGVLSGLEVFFNWPKHSFIHSSALYNRKLALEIDFYRINSISSDTESFLRLCLHGQVAVLPRPVAVWRIHGNNCTQGIDFVKNILEPLQIYASAADYANRQKQPQAAVEAWRRRMVGKFLDDHLGTLMLLGAKARPRVAQGQIDDTLQALHGLLAERITENYVFSRPFVRLWLFTFLRPACYSALFKLKQRLTRAAIAILEKRNILCWLRPTRLRGRGIQGTPKE